MRIKIILAVTATLILLGLQFFQGANNVSIQAKTLEEIQKEIEEYQNELARLSVQSKTLANQVAQFDAQIRLTTLKISQTEEKILLLGGRIDQLENSLDSLTNAFSTRAVETYKMNRLGDGLFLLLGADGINEVVSRYHYLQRIQQSDQDLLQRLQRAQTIYVGEKEDQEVLQKELEKQKAELDDQKAAKAFLLQVTRNDEAKYQQLLAQARSEYEAIQAIIAGKGQETEVGHVSQGARIASIIQGASCNSSGAHLHFIVSSNGITQNPFAHLKDGITNENCTGSSCGSGNGDPFNPTGTWDWPISPTIRYSQGYGETWAVRNTWVGRIYRFHNGIDINSSTSPEVRAVRSGTLYRGSYNVGCALRYVRVAHDDSDLDTFYLHINY